MDLISPPTRNRVMPCRRRLAVPPLILLLNFSLCLAPSHAATPFPSSAPAGSRVGAAGNRPAAPVLAEVGPHHRLWQIALPNDAGRPAAALGAGSYVELASGLNRWDAGRQSWLPAEARFERTRDGYFVARSTQHQVILAPDLNVEAAVDVLTPDEVRLRSTLLGIALIDPQTGRNCLLAELKSCQGTLVSPGEVVYRDAFDGVAADVRYVLGLDRFEQDVILRERITPDVMRELDFEPAQTRLLVLTEFHKPPQPTRRTRHLPVPAGQSFADEELNFGVMGIGAGHASATVPTSPRIPVLKSWEALGGRQILVEAVPYAALLSVSGDLPPLSRGNREILKARIRRTAAVDTPSGRDTDTPPRIHLPEPRPPAATRQALAEPDGTDADDALRIPAGTRDLPPSLPAQSSWLASGVVIDYPLTQQSSMTDFTFRGDVTYYVSGAMSLGGATTIEGGSVVKFAPGAAASLIVNGAVDCQTGPFRQAIFTARDDDSVGLVLPESTGNPGGTLYANPAIQIMRGGQTLHDLRIAHAQTGVFFHDFSAGENAVRHAQFVRCNTALKANGYGTIYQRLTLHNVLIHDTAVALTGYSLASRGEHLTVCQSAQLTDDHHSHLYGTGSSLSLVNCLLVAVGNPGNFSVSQAYCQTASQSNAVFQTVGAGGFYLARADWRNAGTADVHPTLARELKQKTTAAPSLRSGTVTADTSLSPQARRGADLPDPGFHYDPIDLAVSGLVVASNRVLTIAPGTTVVPFGPFGIRLAPSARLRAAGEPLRLARFADYRLVQEQSTRWGSAAASPVVLLGTDQALLNGNAAPSASFRFVEFAASASPGHHLLGDATSRWLALTLQDCQVKGGRIQIAADHPAVVILQNSLFERASVQVRQGLQLTACNDLFRGGSAHFERSANAGPWVIRDTAFHDTDLTDTNGGIAHDHNAYLGSAQRQLSGPTTANVVLPALVYAPGPFGAGYQVSTNLVNQGSRNAADAGLYHFTALASQAKETNSVVDIGFHHVAVGDGATSGQPHDADRDGFADYLEDGNGNGVVDSGETHWQDAHDLGLDVQITRPNRSSPWP